MQAVARAAGLRPATDGSARLGAAPVRVIRDSTRRRRSRRAAGRGRRAPVAPSRRWCPIAMMVPSGASKASSVNPAAAKSARMAGVRSGGRRCRVHITWPPGTQNPRMRLDGARDVRRADVPEHAAHQHDVGRHVVGVPAGTATHRPRRPGSGRPRPGRRRPGPGRRRPGPDRARPAAPRPPDPLDGSPRRRSRHAPGPHTGSPSGSALDGYPRRDRPARSRPARRPPSIAPSAAAARGSTTGPRTAHATAPSATRRPTPSRATPSDARRRSRRRPSLDGPRAP